MIILYYDTARNDPKTLLLSMVNTMLSKIVIYASLYYASIPHFIHNLQPRCHSQEVTMREVTMK